MLAGLDSLTHKAHAVLAAAGTFLHKPLHSPKESATNNSVTGEMSYQKGMLSWSSSPSISSLGGNYIFELLFQR